MSMLLSDLVEELKLTLGEAAAKFKEANNADFIRFLTVAALRLGQKRPRTLIGTVALVNGVATYDTPTDFIGYKAGIWGRDEQQKYKPWDSRHPGRLPRVMTVEFDGKLQIALSPTPNATQIACLGSSYKFYYYAGHTLSDEANKTTVQQKDRELLLLGAVIQAMFQLSNSGTINPMQLHKGMGSQSKASTPAGWFDTLNKQYEAAP